MKTVFVIEPEDNVGTAVHEDCIKKGDAVYTTGRVSNLRLTATADIPHGHKMALRLIRQGERIIKYGLTIGTARTDIQPGDHVHRHNVDTSREHSGLILARR
ncbi:MAG: UxaA family hydrolase [Chloroflexi bacterium]|nr:UxaA family hydrolase [Chloroflexota bacterium]